MNERRLEVVKNRGNFKSKFTVTSSRITVKLRDEDLDKEEEIVELAKKIASQIPLETGSLRGSLSNGASDRLKMSSSSMGVTYLFSRSTGELQRMRKSEASIQNEKDLSNE